MAEMTLEEFRRRTSGANRVTAEQIGEAAAAAPPSSAAAAFAQRRNAEDLSRLAPGATTLRQQLGEQPGTPLDIDSGLGANVEFELARRRKEEDKLRWLSARFGADKVRLNPKGDPIVRINGADGKPRDILVNARGLTVDDLGALAAHVPELAGALLGPRTFAALAGAMTGTKAAQLGTLGKMFASAVGAQVTGGAQDVAVRTMDEVPLRTSEIFMERGVNALADTALQAGMGVGAKAVSILDDIVETGNIPSPVSVMRGPLQQEAIAAAERTRQRTGLPMSMSAGQSTGNPFIAAAEQYLETNPVGAGPQLAGRAAREAERVAFQDWMVNPSTLPLDEEIGRRGIGILTDVADGANATLNAAKARVQREGQIAVTDLLAQRFNKDVAPNPIVISKTIQNSASEIREAYRTESGQRWNALFSHPSASAIRLELTPVGDTASSLLKVWPKDPQTGELITGFGPEGLLSRIQKAAEISRPQKIQTGMLGKTVPATMPLDELHNLRVLLDQQISGGQAITGIKDQKLISLRGAITDAIEKGVKKDPQLESLWRAANDYTKQNAPRFDDKLIDQMFKRPSDAGYVGEEEFLGSIAKSGSVYRRVRDFFGRSSDEMRLVNRNIADGILRRSLRNGFGDELDPEALRKNLAQLHAGDKTRQVFFGVFGKRADAILGELNSMEAAGTLKGNISAREFVASLDPETAARPSIQALLQSQLDTETIYANNVIKRFVKGELPATALHGEEFINWTDRADLTDVQQVMSLLRAKDPALVEQHARRQIQKFFTESSRQPTPSDVLHELQGGTGTLPSGTAMFKQLGNKDAQAKLQEVIGNDQMDMIKDYIKVELSEDEKRRLASGTGILTRGSVISALIHGGLDQKEIRDWAKVKALSYMVASPTMSSWLSSGYKSSDIPDLFKTIIFSEPFIAAVAEDLKGDARAFELISTLRHAGFGRDKQQPPPARSQVPTMTEEEFRRRTSAPP